MSFPPTKPNADSPLRHRFIVVIPVADRPRHIQACLDSLCELLRRFPGERQVQVFIADDSADAANVAANREIAQRYSAAGLPTIHFGPDEQFGLVAPLKEALPRVLGEAPRERFGHKGQGVMRNIASLKVVEWLNGLDDEDALVWSLDSDQEFRVNVPGPEGDREVYAVDYFGGLDAIFSNTDALVLTGKVVGDPPVSPAVMTANFLADVLGFLQRMAASAAQGACGQHADAARRSGEAAYHDMADLFGFGHAQEAYAYACPLRGAHTEADCLRHFAARLNGFFYGEHPTRVSYYEPAELFATVQPARTVYAGNYVCRPAALKYFIPFAGLRLRMSGPTLGRLIKSEIGARFVSANLPMLHRRTVDGTGQSEFRPGVSQQAAVVDLAGEFERQFYGDVMLFSIERLTALGFPRQAVAAGLVTATLDEVRTEMLERYNARQDVILDRLGKLQSLLAEPSHWWNRSDDHAAAVGDFAAFAANVARNFGADAVGYRRINSSEGWREWRGRLIEAVIGYPADRAAWQAALAAVSRLS